VPGNAGGVAWSVGPHPGGRWETGVPEFVEAALLGGGEVRLRQNADGVRLRLGDREEWDLVDTVLVLR
jgi:hypothetical protein